MRPESQPDPSRRVRYASLHAGIGYVTPNDEHTGRGEQIRQERIKGLRRAHQQRLDYHRLNYHHNNPQEPA